MHRHVFETMGTVASLTFDDESNDANAERVDLRRLHATFDHWDSTFSLFTSESELSRIARGELELASASDDVRETYAAALEWRASTHGDFTPHRPDGVIDLSGLVKAMAMERAGKQLVEGGTGNWCLNVGGDVLVSGREGADESWSVGIVDPFDRGSLLASAVFHHSRRACATSGSVERGDHIWSTGTEPAVFLQATVLADDIVTADVLATAIIAGGPEALDRSCASWPIDAMTVDREGGIRMTPGFTDR